MFVKISGMESDFWISKIILLLVLKISHFRMSMFWPCSYFFGKSSLKCSYINRALMKKTECICEA